MPHILVVKCGALGDVVRTSHFAAALRQRHGAALRLSWITSEAAVPLLSRNPHIDDLWTDVTAAAGFAYDRIVSLEEEPALVAAVAALRTGRITGVVPGPDGAMAYTDDAAEWFDMSLISRLGRVEADRLKAANRRSHAQIFAGIFGVEQVSFAFFGDPALEREAEDWRQGKGPLVGLNPFAGARWPSKALPPGEIEALAARLAARSGASVVLFGAGDDRCRNLALAARIGRANLLVPETGDSVLRLAALVGTLDYLITSDSLALHLALAQSVPFLAFFAPTSAAEIDDGGIGVKLVSTAPDAGSYRPDADNRSLTADRILALAAGHRPALFGGPGT